MTCFHHRDEWEREFLHCVRAHTHAHWERAWVTVSLLRGKAKVMRLLCHCQNFFPHPLCFFSSLPPSWPHSFLFVAMGTTNKAITFTNFLRDRCWHNDCFLAGWKGKGQEGSMGTQGGHSEGCPSVLLPGPRREKKANLLSLFSQGGGMQEEGGQRGEKNWGVSEQGRMSWAERKRGWHLAVFKTDRLISVLLSPLIPSSPPASPILQLCLFDYRINGASWHHDCKMFHFSFLQAFTCFVCVQLKDPTASETKALQCKQIKCRAFFLVSELE